MNAHQSVTLVKNDFNNEVDRMTPSVDNSIFAQLFLSWPDGHKVDMLEGMEVK